MDGTRLTRTLLRCGIAAGPFYVAVGVAQILTREGFDIRRHALSQLSNGQYGWVQVANFLVSGLLVIAGALGVRRLLHPGRAGTWGPILLALYGLGLVGAAFFTADPGRGFPPGTPESTTMSRHGLMHFVVGAVGFYALIAACGVFARFFTARRRSGWALYSALTGLGFLISFAAIASGSTATATMLAFYGAILWVWTWHTLLLATLLGEPATR